MKELAKYIYDESNGLHYTLHGDYYLPDLEYHTTYNQTLGPDAPGVPEEASSDMAEQDDAGRYAEPSSA